MIGRLIAWLTGGVLGRVLDTVDRRIDAQSDRERIKAEIIQEHLRTRGDFMRAGGFWLMLIFAAPLSAWFGAVVLYSTLWCQGCAYPQEWSIAALPPPLDEWAGGMILAIFGVVGVERIRR